MPIGNIGSRMVQNYATIDQNKRANRNQAMKEEDWELKRPLRKASVDLATAQTEDALLARDTDATAYGDEYNYGMELKRRIDEKRSMENMKLQMQAMKAANKSANINADMSDQSVIKYGVSGSEKDLSKVAQHTSGSNRPDGNGFYSVGPYQMRSIRPENMSARQRQEMDRIRQNRTERVDAGIYKEETFADGVKRYVNQVSNEVFGQDIWIEDEQGKVYTPEHIKMVTGQTERVAQQYQATQPQSQVEQPSTTPSTPSTSTKGPAGEQDDVIAPLPPQQSDLTQTTVTPPIEQPSGTTDIGQMYTDYDVQNPSFSKEMETLTTQLSEYPEGTAGAALVTELGVNGPEVDKRIQKAVEMYPTEVGNMSPEAFTTFMEKQSTAAPATIQEAKDSQPIADKLMTYKDNYIAEKERNANKPKGSQKATESQQKFMEVTNQPGAIERAIEDGVTNEAELHDWVADKGKFKPMTATQKKDKEFLDISNNMMDRAYPKKEDGTETFSTEDFSKISAKEAMRAQLRLGKASDLKDMEKAYQGANEWYNVRDTIISVSDKRMQLAEIGQSFQTQSDKWFGTFFDDDEGAKRFGQLETTMGKAVANQVKLMSGTAASDKERATIIRYMFGDAGVSHDSFLGAISGYTKMVEDNLPNQAETAFSKNGFAISRKFSNLYEKHKGKSDISPKKKEEKTETRLEMLKRLKRERQGA